MLEETKSKSKTDNNTDDKPKEKVNYKGDGQEIILFFGAPGAGKSTFWK